MRKEISWSKNFFGTTYKLLNYNGKKGELKMNVMSRGATARLGGRSYRFQSKGLLSNIFEMICDETDTLIAKIKLNTWRQRAKITTVDHQYSWKHTNFWQTKWRIFDERREYVTGRSNGFMSGGAISYHPSAEQIVLAGLFIKDHFIRVSQGV